MSKVLSNKAMSLMAASHTVHDKTSWDALWDYIAELEAAQRYWRANYFSEKCETVTHWMPLPKLPEVQE